MLQRDLSLPNFERKYYAATEILMQKQLNVSTNNGINFRTL